MRKLANSAARDIASPAAKMGSRSLFPGVAVPLAFFCTLFFRHRKKSVSAPWDGQSQSAPEPARQSPSGKFPRQSFLSAEQAGGLSARPPAPPSGRTRRAEQGVCACGRTGGFPLASSPLRIANRNNRAPHRAASPLFAPTPARQPPPIQNNPRQEIPSPPGAVRMFCYPFTAPAITPDTMYFWHAR